MCSHVPLAYQKCSKTEPVKTNRNSDDDDSYFIAETVSRNFCRGYFRNKTNKTIRAALALDATTSPHDNNLYVRVY